MVTKKPNPKKGMGFKAAAAATGKPAAQANAIIAAATRGASPKAKAANPNLKKVTMPKASRVGKGARGKGAGKKG